jgi:MOSC domain-containing protein YiiM
MRPGEGILHSINVSRGGVPKTAVAFAHIGLGGLGTDRQNDLVHHGGPDRAVSLYSLERIVALQNEGHPIVAGSIAENLTLSGVDWDVLQSGVRLEVGEAMLELTRPVTPCFKIAASFRDGNVNRVSAKTHPGWNRWYARVLREATVFPGDPIYFSLPSSSS